MKSRDYKHENNLTIF